MKIGVVLPAAQGDGADGVPGWPHVRAFALGAEQRGLDSVWMYDHFYYRNDAGELEGQHEAWTIVSAVAAVTEGIEIGTIVLCVSFRNPGLTAKMAAAMSARVSGWSSCDPWASFTVAASGFPWITLPKAWSSRWSER